MRFTFSFYNAQEISSSAYPAFISTFEYNSDESDLSDFDLNIFGYG